MTKALLSQHNEFIARSKANGAKTMTYKTPCCQKDLEDRIPVDGSRWTTGCTCPHCGAMYMKISTRDGIEGFVPDAA